MSDLSVEVTVSGLVYSGSFSSTATKIPAIINESDKLTLRLLGGDGLPDSRSITLNSTLQGTWSPTVEISESGLRVVFAAAVSPGSAGYADTLNGKSAIVLQDGETILKFENVEL